MSRRKEREQPLPVSISFLLYSLFFLIVSQALYQGTGDVEMTRTCCLYSGSSAKVVTSGKDAHDLGDLKLLQWRFSKA